MCYTSPSGPHLPGQLLPGIAVEQLPELRGKDTPCVDNGNAHGVQIHDLFRALVNADFPPDLPSHHAEGDERAADNVKILGQPPEGDVHILVALGEDVHGGLVMAVVLVEVNRLLGEGLIVPVVVFDARFVDDDLSVFNHEMAYILFRVQTVGSGNGDV